MEARSEPKQKISEIFKEFMTGITKLEELGNVANSLLLRFQQGLGFLQRSSVDTSSDLINNIVKNNETRRLKSYIEAGCFNTEDTMQSTKALHTSLSGLFDHLTKAKSLLTELECLADEAALALAEFSTQLDNESSDELQQLTSDDDDDADEENSNVHLAKAPEVIEYATVIALVYSMVKQDYAMQERIVRSLSLKSSSGELQTYTMMWSLRPFVEDEIMNRAWKWVY